MILGCKRLATLVSCVCAGGWVLLSATWAFFFLTFSLDVLLSFGLSQYPILKFNLSLFHLLDSSGHFVGIGLQYSLSSGERQPTLRACVLNFINRAWRFLLHCLGIRIKSSLYSLPLFICRHGCEQGTSNFVKSFSFPATVRMQYLWVAPLLAEKSPFIYVLSLGCTLGQYYKM